MKPAYIVGQITVTNPTAYATYAAQVPGTLAQHGGNYLVRGGEVTQLEGVSHGQRNVVIQFPSREAAHGWYHGAAYQAIIGIRQANSQGDLLLVDGYAPV